MAAATTPESSAAAADAAWDSFLGVFLPLYEDWAPEGGAAGGHDRAADWQSSIGGTAAESGGGAGGPAHAGGSAAPPPIGPGHPHALAIAVGASLEREAALLETSERGRRGVTLEG